MKRHVLIYGLIGGILIAVLKWTEYRFLVIEHSIEIYGGLTALASFEATRYAAGRKNGLRIELNGSAGSLAFDLERLNELEFFDRTDPADSAGFRRILVTEPGHPYLSGWWPPGHTLGWEHTFTHQARDLLTAIAAGTQPEPSFTDGLAVQRVLDAVQRSAASGSGWAAVEAGGVSRERSE